MAKHTMIQIAVVTLAATAAGVAGAQPTSPDETGPLPMGREEMGAQPMPRDEGVGSSPPYDSHEAASRAVEITIGAGYEQAFGKVASGQQTFTDTATAGGGVQVGIGYRFTPYFAFGVYGTGAEFGRGDQQVDSSAKLYSMSGGVQADIHFVPRGSAFDPWLSLGAGWRGYWDHTGAGTTSIQGLELGKLQVGVDYRFSRGLAISPVIGADMSLFLTRSDADGAGYDNIGGPRINTFLFGGLMGRFDLVPERQPTMTASR